MSDKKKYTSLGQMIKKGDYVTLMETVSNFDEKEIKNLLSTSEENPVSQLNQALFFVPDYCYKLDEEGEKTKDLHEGVFEFLTWAINKGADPQACLKYNNSCFLKSAELPTKDIIEFFVDSLPKLDIHQQDGRGKDVLMNSVANQSEEVLDYLLSTNLFDVNKSYLFLDNKTVLHIACANANETIIDKLLKSGADLTKMDSYENKPAEMIPDPNDPEFEPDEDVTEEKVESWNILFERLSKLTLEKMEEKKSKKTYRTSF